MVVVIGAGATGLGVARDLALRGVKVTVVDQWEPGFGTSGRFHGLLHSGARYVVTDPTAAEDCYRENTLLRAVAPDAIEQTGGIFVRSADDDPGFEQAWLKGCDRAGIPVTALDPRAVHQQYPDLTTRVASAYWVPDGVLEGFHLLQMLAKDVLAHDGTLLSKHRVTAIQTVNGRVTSVRAQGPNGEVEVGCDAVINAAGPWAGAVADLFEDPIPMHLSYGLMILFAHRKFPVVVNRLKSPGDGDIFVPHQHVTILGTTDVAQDSPLAPDIQSAEVMRLMDLGRELVPGLDSWRVLRAFTGVRPLYDGQGHAATSREVSRDFKVIDHQRRKGPAGSFSVVGGKWTTFRLMAERTADIVTQYLGISAPCVTAQVPLTPRPVTSFSASEPYLCECEKVSASQLTAIDGSLSEWRTATWFAMGPCQGTFCAHRVTALQHALFPSEDSGAALQDLRAERTKGMLPVLWGANAREYALQQAVRFQTLAEGDPQWAGNSPGLKNSSPSSEGVTL
ncbi:MAG: glycerol 3-phosphate dehydrogenase [Sulfobacillus thermosulfidooxidans]|nr:MAG: glycerol 3-phosphate dehydrogenase [Sulfobacillus thermosulfidooxidans]